MKKLAVILSGCGVYDGTEIHEAVLTMLAIDKKGAEYTLFAPNKDQYHVIDHLTGNVVNESRNVLTESARIARGNIKDLKSFDAKSFDAIVLPGGFGAAKNLSTYAFEKGEMTVDPLIEKAIQSMHQMLKPIGALCIAPVILAHVIEGATVSIGNDYNTAQDIEQMGAFHQLSRSKEVIIDKTNLLFTTPCYMIDTKISDIAIGAEHLISAILEALTD